MKELLNHLFEHRSLSKAEACSALKDIAAGKYPGAQVASFLTVFRMRSLRVEELEGFCEAMQALCRPIDLKKYQAVDLVGTGGDGKNTFNISTLAALVVAGAGQKVAKHGNYGASSVSGASNVLEALGVKFPQNQQEAERDIERSGFCFLHAPLFHPAMKQMAPLRKELGVRTFFNLLGPLVNPSFPPSQMIGVSSYEQVRLFSYLLQKSERNFMIVHSLDGYDEISLTAPFRIVGHKEELLWEASDLGFARANAEDLSGGASGAEAAALFLRVLNNQGTLSQKQVVIANAAAGLRCARPGQSWADCLSAAAESLESKKALGVLNALRGE